MALEGAGDPQAVDIHVARRLDGVPGHLRREIFDEALAPFHAFEKDQSLVQALGQPGLFGGDLHILIVGDGTADVLLFQILLCDADVFHMLPSSPIRMPLPCGPFYILAQNRSRELSR